MQNKEVKSKIFELIHVGDLANATSIASSNVKSDPSNIEYRFLLAELLLFSNNFERADVILNAASELNPSMGVVAAEFRQLLRAAVARCQLYENGRVPEILEDLSSSGKASLKAFLALREKNYSAAADFAAEAEQSRPHVSGLINGQPFDDFRDMDDLLPAYIEVFTTTGKYYWIPLSRIESIEFHPAKRLRDLFWRRCSMSVTGGPEGDVYIPAIYHYTDNVDDLHSLGRATSWDEKNGLVRGIGQRTFLSGEEDLSIMQLNTIIFNS